MDLGGVCGLLWPMAPMSYVALIRRESASEFLVTFPDVPEALTSGVTLEEARAAAPDALWTALVGYVEAGLP